MGAEVFSYIDSDIQEKLVLALTDRELSDLRQTKKLKKRIQEPELTDEEIDRMIRGLERKKKRKEKDFEM